jgi:CopG family transcriptional regulator, nickel-responsive regulator
MQRITISLDESLANTVDQMSAQRGYTSRSEAMRDLVREGLERWREEALEAAYCVGCLSYIVDRRVRSLPQRIADLQHSHHDLVATSTVVRLDHFYSLETVILRGRTEAVRDFADSIRSERGVRFGAINMLQVSHHDEHHEVNDHGDAGHQHLSPLA